MGLPSIAKPLVSVVIPSTSAVARFRMMTRREEKMLLVARAGGDEADALSAIRQVVSNCSEGSVDVDRLAVFDVEYAFVRIRAASVGSREKLVYHDSSDDKDYTVDVDLEMVEVVTPPEAGDGIIEVGPKAKIKLRWPTAVALADKSILGAADEESALDNLVASCVEKVWVDGEAHDASDYTRDEVIEFLQDLGIEEWELIRQRMASMPHLSYWVSWTNTKGEERRVELRTLTDFFSLA